MSDRALRFAMTALVLVTIGIASYLLNAHYSGTPVACASGGCETVAQSHYSDIFGLPVALIGLLGSVAILVTLIGTGLFRRVAGLAFALTGLIFAAYLIVAQLTVVHAICEWCAANDLLVVVIAIVAALRARADITARA